MTTVRHLGFSYFRNIYQKFKLCLFLRLHGEDRMICGRVTAYFQFSKWQPFAISPYWIWYDVIVDHPRLLFGGRNILLKSARWSCLCFARYRDFYIRLVWLEIAYSRPFLGVLGDITPNEFKNDHPWTKACHMSHKPWKSLRGFDLGSCPIKNTVKPTRKKS